MESRKSRGGVRLPKSLLTNEHGRTAEAMRRLNESLERQARQIAQALHDEAGQFLTSAHIAWQRPVAICRRPRILDDLGLLPALHFLAEGVEKRHGISITIEATLQGRLPAAIETTVYRLAQEASLQVAGRRSP